MWITDTLSDMTRLDLTNPTARRAVGNRQRQYLANRDAEKPRVIKHEEIIQKQVCQYLKMQFPNVMFRSDTSSGRWEYSRAALAAKVVFNSNKSWPDLFIYEPRKVNGVQYAGLAIELKKEGTTIVVTRGTRKGMLTSDPHIQEQYLLLRTLKDRGYYANFACGFDQAKHLIDWYFGRREKENAQLF